MRIRTYLMLLGGIISLSSCETDEYVYPSVLTEFVDIKTSDNGKLLYINSDNGTSYLINERSGLQGFTPDTIYRAVSIFEPLKDAEGKQTAKLYSCQFVASAKPLTEDKFTNGIKTDPVNIDRIWRSGNYINMILDIMAKDKSHEIGFVQNGITESNEGNKTLELTLHHNQNDDYEAFNKRVYASVPLWQYNNILNAGDKIILHINTYKEGETIREFYY